jgi:hypothetical protein
VLRQYPQQFDARVSRAPNHAYLDHVRLRR